MKHLFFQTTNRKAFTLVELLVVIAIIGVLVALLLPAVQSAREAARRVQCKNNLKQIGLAMLTYHDQHKMFPAGHTSFRSQNHCWTTDILPFAEQQTLFDLYDYSFTWNFPGRDGQSGNLAVAETNLSMYLCPTSETPEFRGRGDYGGHYGSSLSGLRQSWAKGDAWESGILIAIGEDSEVAQNTQVRVADVADGTSQTVTVFEDAGRNAVSATGELNRNSDAFWANGHQCFGHDGPAINDSRGNEIFSDHPGGAHGVFADGAVKFLSEDTSAFTIGAISTRQHGEPLAADKL